ncbi:MAG TPA: fluoride efflux transporter CrcB [Acidimicrobiales bacterium]|jgi:CrcB protein
MILVLSVALAGVIGAPARFMLDGWLQRRARTTVPVGTLAVNVSGAFVLGLVLGLLDAGYVSTRVATIVGTGILGAFTTFSTFSFESVRLVEEAAWRPLATYLLTMILGGLVAAGLGLWIASFV